MRTKYIVSLVGPLLINIFAVAQFTDTAQFNNYIRNTFRDRRPQKISANDLQQSFLGITNFLYRTNVDTLDLSEAHALMESGGLQPGKLYYIRNADPELYEGTDVILTASGTRNFGRQGIGFFYNPRYENFGSSESGNGIWQGRETQISTMETTGSFAVNEPIIAENGASGTWISPSLLLTNDLEGVWESGANLTITGQSSGATATINVVQVPVYDSTYSVVVWGGRVWKSKTGNRGYETSDFELNEADWQQVPYESGVLEDLYQLVEDPIEIDFPAQRIVARREDRGNNEVRFATSWLNENSEGNPIEYFQWGNPYFNYRGYEVGAQKDNSIINSLLQNINFAGSRQFSIKMSDKSMQAYCYFAPGSYQENITMEAGSQQFFLYFDAYTSQEDMYLRNSMQYRIAFTNGSQYGFNFILSGQEDVILDGIQQSGFSFWNHYWHRNGARVVASEGPLTHFGELNLNGPGSIVTKVQYSDVQVDGSSTPGQATNLEFVMEENKSYSFEYEVFFNNSAGASTAHFQLINAGYFGMYKANYTLTNQTNGIVQSKSMSTDGEVTFDIGEATDGPYHLRITGIILGTYGGPINLQFGPAPSASLGHHTIEGGSTAKFSKLEGIIL